MNGATVKHHETLRVPQGWKEQEKAFVIQLERILDDIYAKYGGNQAAVTNVEYNDETQKITKTIGGKTTDVVTAETLKTAMAPFTWGQIAGN